MKTPALGDHKVQDHTDVACPSALPHARKTTLQSARDMFGAGHAVGRAIGEAWTAVGIE